ncbi:conjugal transfer pilus assembly protein TraU [Parvularcula oceani]|uniref:conjugal transfer pilus assembly protein TraU n=1 Tax=Parvularcula oceani TaxID=1247963 RepID=UPI0004E1E68F|nr:conjugal transfer pilus assembly protein TraU [Parvularcula oceani]
MRRPALIIAAIACLMTPPARADAPTCGGTFVNPITDICWSCLFPISLGAVPIWPSSRPDTANPPSPICTCPIPLPPFVRIGLSIGYWEPVRLMDVTKKPYCFANLGGTRIDVGLSIGAKSSGQSDNEDDVGSWHVHYYMYPLIYWLELLTDFGCMQTADFDLLYLTEIDPLWNNDELTFLLNPEAVVFANPIAQAACAADCVAASAHLPVDQLFWCAGCHGSMYPMNGNIAAEYGHVQGASLAAERFLYKLHRQGTGWQHSGSGHVCQNWPNPMIKKSEYRLQLVNPVPNVAGRWACPTLGASNVLYEIGKTIPVIGEDYGFLVWQKENCCVF